MQKWKLSVIAAEINYNVLCFSLWIIVYHQTKKDGYVVLKTMIHCALVSLRFAASWDLNSIPQNQRSNEGLRKPDIFSLRTPRNRIFCRMFWNLSSSQSLLVTLYFSSTKLNEIVISNIARWSVYILKD